jgi:hypothetical protein
MNYSKEQINRLKYLLFDEWVVDNPDESTNNLNTALSKIESSEELHQFAGHFNSDGGVDVLRKVINHRLCDKGTALMVYFLLRPGYYYRQLERNKPFMPDQQDAFNLLAEIEEKCQKNAFSSSIINFDPHDSRGQDLLKEDSANPGNRLIPEIMKTPTQGKKVEFIEI